MQPTTQKTTPFTIKPNSIYGMRVKYWIIGWILFVIIMTAALIASKEASYAYFLLPATLAAALGLWFTSFRGSRTLTVTADSYIYRKNGQEVTLPFKDLGSVAWNRIAAGRGSYLAVIITDASKTIKWELSTLWSWDQKEIRAVYEAVPDQYRVDLLNGDKLNIKH